MDGKKKALYRGLILLTMLLLVLPAVSVGEQAKAESAAQTVNVVIPEVLRVSINRSELAFTEGVDKQKVTLKILSNSPQEWMLHVNVPMVQGQMEWSLDGTSWNEMNDTQEVLHGGITKGWKEFSVYYRLKQDSRTNQNVNLNITYDLSTDRIEG